jgi:hypothetical protein
MTPDVCLRYLCLFVYIGVQHIFCCCFVFLRLVYAMLLVSLDCPFFSTPSVFLNVYFLKHSDNLADDIINILILPVLNIIVLKGIHQLLK